MTSNAISLPDGGTAHLRSPSDVTERQRRPLTRLQLRLAGSPVGQLLERQAELAKDKDGNAAAIEALEHEFEQLVAGDGSAMELLDELNDAMVVALAESYEPPAGHGDSIVITADTVLDLPAKALDALKLEAAKRMTELMPSFSPTPDEASPTPPSVS